MSPDLDLHSILSTERLAEAWSHVLTNDAADGVVAPSIRRFAQAAGSNVERLATELATGTYRPRPLTSVSIPKADGSVRELQIPTARDRVVERALQKGLQPVLDPTLSFTSFAYRPGRGVVDAVRRVIELRESGLRAVVRTDIDDCFPSVDRNRLLLRLEQLIPDPPLLDLVASLVRRPVRQGHRQVDRLRGIPQGGALSPLLSNVALDGIDRHLLRKGHQVVHYADDIVIACPTSDDAEAARADARLAAERGGFRLGKDKTVVTDFESGFYFLGEEFNARYPPHLPTARRSEPTQRALYVGVQGAGLRISRGRIEVSKGDDELLSVPTGHVDRIVLSGSVGISSGARSWALYNDVDVVLLSRRGSFLGTINGGHSDATLLRGQLAVVDDEERRLQAAIAIVRGKLRNQQVLLTRFVEPRTAEPVAEAVDDIGLLDDQAVAADSLDVLLGVEGMAARRYWAGYGALLPDVGFEGRYRRPPPDLVNAALGYGYAILLGGCVAACQGAGLHPSFGLLRAEMTGAHPWLSISWRSSDRSSSTRSWPSSSADARSPPSTLDATRPAMECCSPRRAGSGSPLVSRIACSP